ncbi:MAG: bifunctional phosphoribosylaminoimidazolecarboxamide formyltransferase/IMP cyclohydrolase [Aquificaceae bacterium]|nr:bifunctional phosphoribosylaminoimidazolecarboxamide formyltransferase/IMP cyclohydrolase [Aquificaceae bacterium]MDW8066402.1 bifunctional phosphoribosylaminoimidazolecarboxamide formyltransferase/IMP cyclohydrolase [Aquificaceae bacterium]
MKALISVYYKQGLEPLLKALEKKGYDIISTGGTAKFIKDLGYKVKLVEELTGFPEILDGRVKTLHPVVHGGILFRDWVKEDAEDIKKLHIEPIDLVVVNLYPFEEKLREDLTERELMEFIDIGGPTLIRASAKNFYRVAVVVDPEDYGWVAKKIEEDSLSLEDRKFLAVKAFSLTAYYDALVSGVLMKLFEIEHVFKHSAIPMKLIGSLRYGENPHQRGWMFQNPLEDLGIVSSKVLQGKEMSFNNYLDSDSAFRLVSEFNEPACVIVKHNNPCGVALGRDLLEAFERAYNADPESAFGGIVAFNDRVERELASRLLDVFLEVVVAPDFSEDALEVFSKKKNLRLVKAMGFSTSFDIKKVSGGFLLQDEDTIDYQKLEVVSERKPTEEELRDLLFAWKVCKYVKSNAVVIAKDGKTMGIGSGNVSRVDSLRCAISRAKRFGFDTEGSVVASEAFLPFRDSVDIAKEAGIRAIIQPGGSIRDKEVIEAVNQHQMAMVFTGTRHFRH